MALRLGVELAPPQRYDRWIMDAAPTPSPSWAERTTRHREILAGRDPLEVLRLTVRQLTSIVEEHSVDDLRRRPFEGKWTPNEILGHLVDHEMVSLSRIRTLRFNESPWVGRYDQERWVADQRHNDREPRLFVERFENLRPLNLEQYESASPDEYARRQYRPDGTAITLGDLMKAHAGHDLIHLDQISRYLQAISAGS